MSKSTSWHVTERRVTGEVTSPFVRQRYNPRSLSVLKGTAPRLPLLVKDSTTPS